MVIPNDIDGSGLQKPPYCLRTPLVTMTGTVLREGRCTKLGARLVRRHWAHIIGVHRITKKQEEIELLSAQHIENRVAGCAAPAVPLAPQIAAPGKGHGHLTCRIGKCRKFALCG